jgi:hypothetical protein
VDQRAVILGLHVRRGYRDGGHRWHHWVALVLPSANTEAFSLHLAEISKEVASGAHAILTVDGVKLSTTLYAALAESKTPFKAAASGTAQPAAAQIDLDTAAIDQTLGDQTRLDVGAREPGFWASWDRLVSAKSAFSTSIRISRPTRFRRTGTVNPKRSSGASWTLDAASWDQATRPTAPSDAIGSDFHAAEQGHEHRFDFVWCMASEFLRDPTATFNRLAWTTVRFIADGMEDRSGVGEKGAKPVDHQTFQIAGRYPPSTKDKIKAPIKRT